MAGSAPFRLAEILGSLSLVTDLGMGHPPEEAIRACLLATRLARELGIEGPELRDIYYTALLRYLGCNGAAHEESAAFGGEDIAIRGVGAMTDFQDPKDVLAFLATRVGRGMATGKRLRMVAAAATSGKRVGAAIQDSFCEVAAVTARRLELPASVYESLFHIFERWDGKGAHGLSREEIPLPTRFATLASLALIFDRVGGPEAALTVIAARAGKALDPELSQAFVGKGSELLAGTSSEDVWAALLDVEPEPVSRIDEFRIDSVARAFADLTDLKSPFFHGHSSGVADLVEEAARVMKMDGGELTSVRRAALLHDLGRAGISNVVWEKPRALSVADWEQVRLHPYHTDRILSRTPALAPLGKIAGMHHERLNGNGYHRQLEESSIPLPARLIAVADTYHAMTEDRPHRKALTEREAAAQVRKDAKEGRLDTDATTAVLEVAGHAMARVRREWPANLTDREVQVIRLLARGMSNKQIAKGLFLSPHTVRHHTIHIYEKIGVSSRAGAALFAMEKSLL